MSIDANDDKKKQQLYESRAKGSNIDSTVQIARTGRVLPRILLLSSKPDSPCGATQVLFFIVRK